MLAAGSSRGIGFPAAGRWWTPRTLSSFLVRRAASRSPVSALASAPDPRGIARVASRWPAWVECRPPRSSADSSTRRSPLVRFRVRVPFSTCRPRRSAREQPAPGPCRFDVVRPRAFAWRSAYRPCGFWRLASAVRSLRLLCRRRPRGSFVAAFLFGARDGPADRAVIAAWPGRSPRRRSWDFACPSQFCSDARG